MNTDNMKKLIAWVEDESHRFEMDQWINISESLIERETVPLCSFAACLAGSAVVLRVWENLRHPEAFPQEEILALHEMTGSEFQKEAADWLGLEMLDDRNAQIPLFFVDCWPNFYQDKVPADSEDAERIGVNYEQEQRRVALQLMRDMVAGRVNLSHGPSWTRVARDWWEPFASAYGDET